MGCSRLFRWLPIRHADGDVSAPWVPPILPQFGGRVQSRHYPEITPPRSLIDDQETADGWPHLGWRGFMSLFATPVSDDSNTPRRRFTGAVVYHQTTPKKKR
jgi:hypothetical protein